MSPRLHVLDRCQILTDKIALAAFDPHTLHDDEQQQIPLATEPRSLSQPGSILMRPAILCAG